MQNNVTELTQRLLRALDSNYNVIDMPEVVDIISRLEKVAITKELLETTRLGKHVNELRRKTNNDSLSRRAKELLKKWRSMVLPEANGQIKTSPPLPPQQMRAQTAKVSPPLQAQQLKPSTSPVPPMKVSPPLLTQPQRLASPKVSPVSEVSRLVSPKVSPSLQTPSLSPNLQNQKISPPLTVQNADVNLNQLKSRKRPAKESLDNVNAKRARVNGGVTDLEISDNSNSSFKDVILSNAVKAEPKRDVIIINSDSNSSFPEKSTEPLADQQQQPKKRGRKKGSKNHKNLLDEAETSFTNKLAVSASRGSSKVKTTQELLASIQNKNSVLNTVLKPKEDLEEKAAKLTERVSIIDQKLNTNAHRNKNSQKSKLSLSSGRNERVIESGSVINDKSLLNQFRQDEEDEIVVVDDVNSENDKTENQETDRASQHEDANIIRSLSVEEALSLLPPIDKSVLLEDSFDELHCTCFLKENKPDFSIDDEEEETLPPFEIIEDPSCPAKGHLSEKYHTDDISEEKILRLHGNTMPNVNGNFGMGIPKPEPQIEDELFLNIVPNIYERLDRDVNRFNAENFKKYSVSENGPLPGENVIKTEENEEVVIKKEDDSDVRTENETRKEECFREWFECVDKESYDGDMLRVLPYCIVD